MKNYGRSSKLLLAEKDIPDLHFDVMDASREKEKGESPERTEVMEIMEWTQRKCDSTTEQRFPRTFKKFAGKCSR